MSPARVNIQAMRLRHHQRVWDDLANLDPLWAIASTPGRRYGGWDDDAFMASGRRKVDRVMRQLDALGAPGARRRALDFGCGVGRLTIPLAAYFDEVLGIDIAPGMVEEARSRAAAAGSSNVRFLLNEDDRLQLPAGERFDLVFTSQVLQHLPSRRSIARYVRDLIARVAPGGVLIAQVPDRIDLTARLQLSRRAYAALRGLGVPRSVLYERLHLSPIEMRSFPRRSFESLVEGEGLRIASIVERRRPPVLSCTYVAVHE
jgi:SAM-dependent methyltransferase